VLRPFGSDALTDQRLGGGLMWSMSMVIDSIWLAVAVSDWFRSEERRALRIDEEIKRELAS
jgi:cytochrome c oxidase assembly factor CtaG